MANFCNVCGNGQLINGNGCKCARCGSYMNEDGSRSHNPEDVDDKIRERGLERDEYEGDYRSIGWYMAVFFGTFLGSFVARVVFDVWLRDWFL